MFKYTGWDRIYIFVLTYKIPDGIKKKLGTLFASGIGKRVAGTYHLKMLTFSFDISFLKYNLKIFLKLKKQHLPFFLLRCQDPHLHLHWVDLPHYIENMGKKNLKWQLEPIH